MSGPGVTRLLLLMFVLRYCGRSYPRLEAAIFWLLPLIPLGFYAAGEAVMSVVRLPWYSLTALPMWFCIYLLLRHSAWRIQWSARLILISLLCGEVLAIHDWLVAINLLPFGTLLWQGYGAGLLLAAMALALAGEYFAAFANSRELNRTLELRVAEKAAELEANFATLTAYQNAAALAQERSRLMRDMHDGIGSQLITTANAVERGQLRQTEVAALLRECVDDLRLVIDSLEPANSDLALALAGLRYRLEPRLRAAGLTLHWQVAQLPLDTRLNPQLVLQILRIVQEALTNIIKHAQAQQIQFTARVASPEARLELVIEDDGAGFSQADLTPPLGRGIGNMQHRARAVGGAVEVFPRTGAGTCVRLLVPLDATRRG